MRGVRGIKARTAVFRRDVNGSDSEGQIVGIPKIITQCRGVFESDGAEAGESSAGRPFEQQKAIFKCRPSKPLQAGDYCTLLNVEWYVDSVERTSAVIKVNLITPIPQPFR